VIGPHGGNGKQDLGLFFLSVTGAFSLWSATNTSYTGHMAFGVKDPESARTAMKLGLAFIALQAVALYLLYGRRALAASAGAMVTGAALYAIYDRALTQAAENPPPTAGIEPGQLSPRSAGPCAACAIPEPARLAQFAPSGQT